ncbi:hypothetical protein [Burkholderia gladioli]|uniref:hypothetical protein n=1 Tax=Burkholderia gladioli TaxID=28095 RepID=UPI001FC8E73E|nr:hypothetical protein [Burkholderia gladioli]
MRDLPILFSPLMVAAERRGDKSQTRRPLRPQPFHDDRGLLWWHWSKHAGSACDHPIGAPSDEWLARCPYGGPGDQLWVRETFVAFGRWETRFNMKKGRDEWHFVDMTLDTGRQYRYGGDLPNAQRDSVTPTWWRRPAIFMPRAASRTQLEVISNRIERVQQISEADAIAEGMSTGDINPVGSYAELWDSLNAEHALSWAANPWVWVVEFKNRQQAAIDRLAENAHDLGLYNFDATSSVTQKELER